jgi:hypothetical protein
MGGARAWSIGLGVLLLAGCSGSAITSVTVSASPLALQPGQTATLAASVLGTGNFSAAVTWSIDGGGPGLTVSGGGASYTAPTVGAPASVVIRATSSQDSSKSGTATLGISASPIAVVVTPDAMRLYSGQTINVNGTVSGPAGVGTGVNWTVVSGGGAVSPASGTDVQFTAPAVSAEQVVVLRATPVADTAQHTDVSLTVDHGWPAVVESTADSAQNAPLDVARGVAVDYSSFAVYVAGETSGGHFDVPSFGGQDGFVAKLDSYGNLAWVRQFGTPSTEFIAGVVADTSGNVYVGGTSSGRFPDSTAPVGGDIGFVIAYDKDGTFKWRQDIGPVGVAADCGVHGLAMDTAQLVYAAGFCIAPLGFVQRCAAAGCTGADGLLTVVSTMPPLPFPYFQGIAVDAFGNYDLVGVNPASTSVQPTGFVTQVHPNDCPPGLAPCTPAWAAVLAPDSPASSLELVAVATDGSNVYVGGDTDGTVHGGPSLGGKDAVLALYDRTGSPQWVQQFGTSSDDTLTGLAVDVIVSHNLLPTGTIDQGGGLSDVFLSFYAFDGTSPTAQVTFEPPENGQPVTSQGGGVAIADGQGNVMLGYTTGAQLGGPPVVGLHVGVRKLDAFGNPLPL